MNPFPIMHSMNEGNKIKELHDAARNGNIDQIRRIISAYKFENVDVKDEKNQTALMWASWSGDVQVVEYLVNLGADVNFKDKTGCAPLMWAVDHDCLEVVEYLIEKCSAEVNPKNRRNYTPLMHAAANNGVEILDYLLKAGAEIDAVDVEYGYTPLMWAVENGHFESVKFLVNNGKASLTIVNQNGQLAAGMANDKRLMTFFNELQTPDAPPGISLNQQKDQPSLYDKLSHTALEPHLKNQLVNMEFQLKLEQKKLGDFKNQMQEYSNAALEALSQERSTNDGLRRQLCLSQEKYKKLTLDYRPPLDIFTTIDICDSALHSLTQAFKEISQKRESLQSSATDNVDHTCSGNCCTICGKEEKVTRSFPFELLRICKGCAMQHSEKAQCNCFIYKKTIESTSRVYGLK